MKVKINKSIACGTISAPPSKSYSHRYIIASLLSNEKNILHNVSLSDDIMATLECVKTFGAVYEIKQDSITIFPNKEITINPVFNCHESGSTLRFFFLFSLLKYSKSTFLALGALNYFYIEPSIPLENL